jgi:hypothetical protein
MGTLIEDAATTSTWIAAALSSSGYDMDFTPPRVDRKKRGQPWALSCNAFGVETLY